MFDQQPVEKFFQVLERIRALEPRVEHAVRENEIRRARAAQRAPHTEAVVKPQPMNNHRIEITMSMLQPRHQTRRVAVISSGPKRMHGDRKIAQPRRIWRIEANDLDL